jgi:hypothetical protein
MIFGSTVILSILLASPLAKARLVLLSNLQQSQSSEQAPRATTPPSPPASTGSKPCATSATTSVKPADCTPARRKKTKQHSATPASSSGTGSTKVIRNGGTSEPIVAISPAESQQQAIQELSTTNQHLANADANLRELSRRQLSEDDEGTVKQIQVYMQQARAAVKNGEAQRAYVLANKADMLSADLVRPRR